MQINLDKCKVESRRTFETVVKINGYRAACLYEQLQNPDDLHDTDKYSSVLEGLSMPTIKEMAEKCLSGENYIRLQLLPETLQP